MGSNASLSSVFPIVTHFPASHKASLVDFDALVHRKVFSPSLQKALYFFGFYGIVLFQCSAVDLITAFTKNKYGPVAQLGERSVRIREVVGSNPIRSTIRSTVILIELRWIFLLLLSGVPVGTAVFTERKWRSLRPPSWCCSPQPGKYRRILLLPSAKPPEAVRHRAHRLRRLFLCKP